MKVPPIFLACELYNLFNIRAFLKSVNEKETKEAALYNQEKRNLLETLGIDNDPESAKNHDFFTRMQIKMIGDL